MFLSTGEVQAGPARLTDGIIAMNPDGESGELNHYFSFGDLIVDGVPEREKITRSDFSGFFAVVPWHEHVGDGGQGVVTLSNGGRDLSVELEDPLALISGLHARYDEQCQWSVLIGGCM